VPRSVVKGDCADVEGAVDGNPCCCAVFGPKRPLGGPPGESGDLSSGVPKLVIHFGWLVPEGLDAKALPGVNTAAVGLKAGAENC